MNLSIQNPPGFTIETESQKAAAQNGFRIELGNDFGWLCYASTTAEGKIWIAASSERGPWFLSLSHEGVTNYLRAQSALNISGPGIATYIFETLTDLYEGLNTTYRYSVSLPDAPLKLFQAETNKLPKTTDAERMVVQRVGQNLFREALLNYWDGKCPLTGITDKSLLRASHIIPWSDCESDAQRLNVYNGLLLSALWDAAFDKGLVSFSDDGSVLTSPQLSSEAITALGIQRTLRLSGLTPEHKSNLANHRKRFGF